MTVARFAIIESGRVANVIEAPEGWPEGIRVDGMDPEPGIGWGHDGVAFVPPPAPPQPDPTPAPTPTTPRMTHFAFQSRLTIDEDIALELALPTSPMLRVAMRRFNAAQDVDVSLPEMQQLLGLLATTPRVDDPQQTIVAPERIPALLTLKPITERGAINPITGYVTP